VSRERRHACSLDEGCDELERAGGAGERRLGQEGPASMKIVSQETTLRSSL
jgi:hypothetical protein